ncbi:S28 family serine protease [Streptomyces sp. NPDC127039]|uniref:S28 family serine protease n=1 Tax=Streptomyces sp. NPDC127039 TaxID=3347115 RepID=UPI003668B035
MRRRPSRSTLVSGAVLATLLVPLAAPTATATGTAATAPAAPAQGADVVDRLLAIPGMKLVEEKPYEGYRFLVLTYTQPVDHTDRRKGTFEQRLTILHKGIDRPTVFSTSGYGLPVDPNPSRAEPTRLIDGNQVSLEYRFFRSSRPDTGTDFSTLTSEQGAADQHRLFKALKPLYRGKWIATGASKGGMTATHYERFHPHDMDGVVAYVAPNDADRPGDSAYSRFILSRGTRECRDALATAQTEALERRETLAARYERYAADNGITFDQTFGTADRAFEMVVLDTPWAFWQYYDASSCDGIPGADATDDELWTWFDTIAGFSFYNDQGLDYYTPYYYQAGTQLGAPVVQYPYLKGLLKYPDVNSARTYVRKDIPMPAFDPSFTKDVDRWVRTKSEHMLFIYGENDPWSAERFTPATDRGKGHVRRDNHVLQAPGANHGASIAQLGTADQELATDALLRWAGLSGAGEKAAAVRAPYDRGLDRADTAPDRARGRNHR